MIWTFLFKCIDIRLNKHFSVFRAHEVDFSWVKIVTSSYWNVVANAFCRLSVRLLWQCDEPSGAFFEHVPLYSHFEEHCSACCCRHGSKQCFHKTNNVKYFGDAGQYPKLGFIETIMAFFNYNTVLDNNKWSLPGAIPPSKESGIHDSVYTRPWMKNYSTKRLCCMYIEASLV